MKQCCKGCFFFLRQHRGVVFCFRSDEREGFVSIRKEYEFFSRITSVSASKNIFQLWLLFIEYPSFLFS